MANKRGRKEKTDNVLSNLEKIEKWMIHKNSDTFIAENLGLGMSTWMKYKNEIPELIELIKNLPQKRAAIVEDVKGALIERAKGIDYEESKTVIVEDEATGKPKILRKEIYKKKSLPDPVAAKEVLFMFGDEDVSSRATFNIKLQELEIKKEIAKANEEWVIPEGEDK